MTNAIVHVVTNSIRIRVGGTVAIADSNDIGRAHAVVYVVADSVGIGIRRAASATHAEGVELIAVTIAVSCRDAGATAFLDRTRAIADPTGIQGTDAVVHVVTNAVRISVSGTVAIAHSDGVGRAHAVVYVVADSVGIGIRRAASATHAEGVELIAVTIAVSCRDAGATAFLDRTGAIANPTSIKRTHAVVHVVTNAVRISIRRAVAVADSEGIIGTDAVVDLVANLVSIDIVEAVAITIEVGLRVGAVVGAAQIAGRVQRQGCGRGGSARREVLDVDRAPDVAVGGQLGEQHASIRIGGAIGIAIVDEPQTADEVIDDHIPPGLKRGGPVLVG